MNYTNTPKDITAQIQLLQSRGLVINDTPKAEKVLQSISFFRLNSYLRTFEINPQLHTYAQGTTLQQALTLCHFDNEMRSIIFKALREIELAMRAKMIQVFSMRYGAFWFIEPTLFKSTAIHNDCLASIKRELHRSNEEFIAEYYRKYTSPAYPPVWKSLEVASFGTLSKLFSNFADAKVKNQVAHAFGLPNYTFLEGWIQCAVVLRNACAHHARVWNRRFAVKPAMPGSLTGKWISPYTFKPIKIYPQLCYIAYLCQFIEPQSHFTANIKSLLTSVPGLNYHAMGFPKKWQSEPLWQDDKPKCCPNGCFISKEPITSAGQFD